MAFQTLEETSFWVLILICNSFASAKNQKTLFERVAFFGFNLHGLYV
jgi:hypothetical protein